MLYKKIMNNEKIERLRKTISCVSVYLIAHYQNATLFHGHSHTHFCTQEQDSHAVYSTNLGFRSIHVPSSANARLIINGSLGTKDASYSLGYLVDVYADCIVLNGLDIVNNKYVPIGTYKINTTLVNIPEKHS